MIKYCKKGIKNKTKKQRIKKNNKRTKNKRPKKVKKNKTKKGGMMEVDADKPSKLEEVNAYLEKLRDDTISIDLSGCELFKIPNLRRFTLLKSLDLNNNYIKTIDGYILDNLKRKGIGENSIFFFDIRNNLLKSLDIITLINLRTPTTTDRDSEDYYDTPDFLFDIVDLNCQGCSFKYRNINLDEFIINSCKFQHAQFDNTSFYSCTFTNVDFENANFSNCDFNGSEFTSDRFVNFRQTDFSNSDFSNFEEEYTKIYSGNFENADLRGTNFSGAELFNCNFIHADFEDTNFSVTNLTRCVFGEDHLLECDFSGADLKEVSFLGSDLRGANFTGALFDNTLFQDVVNREQAIGLNVNDRGIRFVETQPFQTGVAFRVHNRFDTINLDRLYEFLSKIVDGVHGQHTADTIVTPDNNDEVANAIYMRLYDYIQRYVSREDQDKYYNYLDRVVSGLRYFNFLEPITRNKRNVSFARLIFVVLMYVELQPREFVNDYVRNLLEECVTAYEGEQSISCPAGIKDRIIISLAAATVRLSENEEYEELKEILKTNPAELFQDFRQQWFKYRKTNSFPKIETSYTPRQIDEELEKRKQDYIEFMKEKFVSVDVNGNDITNKILKDAEDLKMASMFDDEAFEEMNGGRFKRRLRKIQRKKF